MDDDHPLDTKSQRYRIILITRIILKVDDVVHKCLDVEEDRTSNNPAEARLGSYEAEQARSSFLGIYIWWLKAVQNLRLGVQGGGFLMPELQVPF